MRTGSPGSSGAPVLFVGVVIAFIRLIAVASAADKLTPFGNALARAGKVSRSRINVGGDWAEDEDGVEDPLRFRRYGGVRFEPPREPLEVL